MYSYIDDYKYDLTIVATLASYGTVQLELGGVPVLVVEEGIESIPITFSEYRNSGILLITYFCGSEVAMKP